MSERSSRPQAALIVVLLLLLGAVVGVGVYLGLAFTYGTTGMRAAIEAPRGPDPAEDIKAKQAP
jgi:hypothetical protein